ncbi:MAG TPA: hypothetical protein VFJ13_06445 [Paracoccaceae bacterium]|nr:hypothetical protein [Paracoccaceae bacterium]
MTPAPQSSNTDLNRSVQFAAAVLALVAAPHIADAQVNCATRARVVERLAVEYGEHFSGGGMESAAAIFEVWTSEGGTWTILLTRPDGTSCVMASGVAWREATPEPEGTEG